MAVSGLGELLQHVGAWRVGSECHVEVDALVTRAERDGYVGRRLHYAPAHPTEGDPAFEITDAGLAKLKELAGDEAAAEALRIRTWYRERTSRPLETKN